MRDELLDDTVFDDVDHARELISAWSHRYNEEHPHSALGWLPPTPTRSNGHNNTNNNQQPSRHPAHKTRPGQKLVHEYRLSVVMGTP